MNTEPPRPSYDPSVLRDKRRAEQATLMEALKSLLGFGKCKVVRPSDEAMAAALRNQNDH